jgi:hypothetical protein
MIVKYSMIRICTLIISEVVFNFWWLQFMKTGCHTSRLRFSKKCILVLLCLEMICYQSPPTTHYQKTELHMAHFTTVVSLKLTSCINGNSAFNGQRSYTSRSSKTYSTIGETRYFLCKIWPQHYSLSHTLSLSYKRTHTQNALLNVEKFSTVINNFKFPYLSLVTSRTGVLHTMIVMKSATAILNLITRIPEIYINFFEILLQTTE